MNSYPSNQEDRGESGAASDEAYYHRVDRLRAEREASLVAPGGWLRLVGLEWIKPGPNTIGAAPESELHLPKGPPRLGTISLDSGNELTMVVHPDPELSWEGQPATSIVLRDDNDPQPSEIACSTLRLSIIDRSGRKAVRIEDSEALGLSDFGGLEYFPTDRSWQISARWEPFDPIREIEIVSVIGSLEKLPVPGKAVFEREGQVHELLAIQESPDSLFFIFADQSSAKETYGGGRYLDAFLPRAGTVELDFNLARNPPCAFTPYATCPLAPLENRLKLFVQAGEKMYHGGQPH